MNTERQFNRDEQRAHQDREIEQSLGRIRHKILVMSGKGGVGKSTVAVNLAVGLANRGHRVGLMDVDLHGPSIPQMLGFPDPLETRAEYAGPARPGVVTFAGGKIVPARYGERLSVVSIECMLENNETAVIWRGPMKIGAIRQFIADVQWNDLDYLVIDSPPGTGDEPLTIAQTIAGARAVIVTTPQNVSLRDVRKSIDFCRKVNMDILGLIENMSGFRCPRCNEWIDLFTTGGGRRAAEKQNIPFLGAIPIIREVVTACDRGTPAIEASRSLEGSFIPILERMEQELDPREHAAEQSHSSETEPQESAMKIAIPLAEGKLSMHFGHCSQFALVEIDEPDKKILKQELVPAPEHEPGLLPKWLHEQGANVIIAGGMGSRAQGLFAQNGITVITGARSESPDALVMNYLNGTLATGSNVCDH